ncbi:aldolase [Clostridiales bacterium PH28_bin88]|nr:aldolase [Clostridiales bacterium PH28_bin88]
MLLGKEREKVISIALKCRKTGLVTLTFGNFSLRDRETGYVCITPSGMDYEELTPEDIVVVDVEGRIVEGKRKPSVETPMHCLVYKKRPDVFGICHTHSVFATAWASCQARFPVVVAELAALVGEEVRTAPYRPMGTVQLAEIVADTLADKHAVLLANHGVLAVGADPDTAFVNAVVVEEGAKIAFYAQNIGKLNVLPPQDCQALRQWMLDKYGQK